MGNKAMKLRDDTVKSKYLAPCASDAVAPRKNYPKGFEPEICKSAVADSKTKRIKVLQNELNAGLTVNHTFKPELSDSKKEELKSIPTKVYEPKKEPLLPKKHITGPESWREKYPVLKNARKADPDIVCAPTHAFDLRQKHRDFIQQVEDLIENTLQERQNEVENIKRIRAVELRSKLGTIDDHQKLAEKKKRMADDQKRRNTEYNQFIQNLNVKLSRREFLFEKEAVKLAINSKKGE
jgi:hypothetical protein